MTTPRQLTPDEVHLTRRKRRSGYDQGARTPEGKIIRGLVGLAAEILDDSY